MPLRSGGALANERVCGRSLLGLISVGAKPCPRGEQIVNGGFETGDFFGWSVTGNPHVYDAHPYEGTYHACLGAGEAIEQELSNPVPASCLTAASVFSLQTSINLAPSAGALIVWRVTLGYTDDSVTTIKFSEDAAGCGTTDYRLLNLKPYVEPGKTLKSIKIEVTTETVSYPTLNVDAVTCFV